ncbi:enoyl-CoA hydratase family protein [Streptomyces sp. NPDC054933]|jgi:enoyl-CoA hydratase
MAYVQRDHDRGVRVLTLDSPHNRNALSTRLVTELHDELAAAAKDPQTRAVLLTHTGTTFCAGADLTERAPTGPEELARLLRCVVELPKPVVARVTGHVRAGGLGLLAACDVAVAGPEATFAFTEARLGLAPAVISLTVLPRAQPRAIARYYLTGEVFGTAEALRIGLVSAGQEALDGILDGLRAASPQGLAESKRLTTAELLRGFDRDTGAYAEQSARLFTSAAAAEGVRAFLERREPSWKV